ncbi:MAG TPA: hypothetical protein VMI94_26110 [Bryobacteraceae bacterium]|nr:hypothetical protein [Bryobacteraceae bacterium]
MKFCANLFVLARVFTLSHEEMLKYTAHNPYDRFADGRSKVPESILVKQAVGRADETHVHDERTQSKIKTGKYRSTEIYPTPRDPALKKEYEEYKKEKLGHQ